MIHLFIFGLYAFILSRNKAVKENEKKKPDFLDEKLGAFHLDV